MVPEFSKLVRRATFVLLALSAVAVEVAASDGRAALESVGLAAIWVFVAAIVARFVPAPDDPRQKPPLWVFLLLLVLKATSVFTRTSGATIGALLLANNFLVAGGAVGLAVVKTRRLNKAFATIAKSGGTGEYWGLKEGSMHLIQFSGLKGIKICGEIPWHTKNVPDGGFPVGMSLSGGPELVLYKGSCINPPPFQGR